MRVQKRLYLLLVAKIAISFCKGLATDEQGLL